MNRRHDNRMSPKFAVENCQIAEKLILIFSTKVTHYYDLSCVTTSSRQASYIICLFGPISLLLIRSHLYSDENEKGIGRSGSPSVNLLWNRYVSRYLAPCTLALVRQSDNYVIIETVTGGPVSKRRSHAQHTQIPTTVIVLRRYYHITRLSNIFVQ